MQSPVIIFPVNRGLKDVKKTMETLETDDGTLTHLLGYLSAKQWADALKTCTYTALIWVLIRQQDKAYNEGHALEDEVTELLGNK